MQEEYLGNYEINIQDCSNGYLGLGMQQLIIKNEAIIIGKCSNKI